MSTYSIVFSLVTVTMLLFAPLVGSTCAQERVPVPEALVAGVIVLPPLAMKDSNGVWRGIGIGLLNAVASELNTAISIREFDSASDLEQALSKGEVDLSPCVSIREDLEVILDFSNPYHRSGTGIAASTADNGHILSRVAKIIFSIYSHKVIAILLSSWIVAGTLVWLFERKSNATIFEKGIAKGVGAGIWWASVTMTTVGYGDKAPKTIGGRIVAIAWMFCSIVMISGLTAIIASGLTADEIQGKVRSYHDLPRLRVGAMEGTHAIRKLGDNGVAAIPFGNVQDGLKAITENNIDAFVADESILKYNIMSDYPERLYVLDRTFDHYYVSFALPPRSKIREPLNRALLRITANLEWGHWLKRYLSV